MARASRVALNPAPPTGSHFHSKFYFYIPPRFTSPAPSQYANQSYTSSSNKKAYPRRQQSTYASASAGGYNLPPPPPSHHQPSSSSSQQPQQPLLTLTKAEGDP
ncbi:hypothetical protein P692DRAFT_20871832 [Suillus brevipes Sb2]|nr:hypothetical protein P692DRAFT_20871832 [Suillus brevipes Sb2]